MMLSAALVLSALLAPWDYSRFGSRVHVVSVKGSIPESDVLAPLWPRCGAEWEVAEFLNPAALCSQERGRKRRSGAHRGLVSKSSRTLSRPGPHRRHGHAAA